MWYPEKIRKRAVGIVSSVFPEAEAQGHSEILDRFIINKTQGCLQLLSEKLGSNEFFMGKSAPTTIDSVVFSYLSFFWKVPISHNPVKELLKLTPNLETYLARILQRYFPVCEFNTLLSFMNYTFLVFSCLIYCLIFLNVCYISR